MCIFICKFTYEKLGNIIDAQAYDQKLFTYLKRFLKCLFKTVITLCIYLTIFMKWAVKF